MWRSGKERAASATARLGLAEELWGWKPHARQRELFASPAQVRVAACGRRWGKTECLSLDVASLALTEAGCRQLIVAPTDVQARLLGGEVLRRLLAAFESGHDALRGRTLTVRQRPSLCITIGEPLSGASASPSPSGRGSPSPSGRGKEGEGRKAAGGGESVIWCRSAGRDGRSLRGLWAHRIVVDEAGAVPDTVLTDVLLPMLIDVGGEYVLASSPMGRRSAYYRLFVKGQAHGTSPQETSPRQQAADPLLPKGEGLRRKGRRWGQSEPVTYASFRCPTSDNPHLDHAFLLAQREDLGEAAARQEMDAEFVDDFGAVFREEDIQAALREDARVSLVGADLVSEPQSEKIYTVGIDWGRKLDFTVVCVLECCREPTPRGKPLAPPETGGEGAEHPLPASPSEQGEGQEGEEKDRPGPGARVVGLWRWQGVGWDAQVAAVTAFWFDAPRDPPLIILRDCVETNPLLFQGQVNAHHDFLALYFVQHGRGTHVINGVPHAMARGDVYIMGFGASHQYKDCAGMEVDALYFPPSLLDAESLAVLRRQPTLRPFLEAGAGGGRWKHLSPLSFEEINAELSELKREWASATEIGGVLTRALFVRLLIHLAQRTDAFDRQMATIPAAAPASVEEAVALAVHLLETGFTEPLHMDDVARTVGMSLDWLAKMFDRLTGRTPRDYLRALRLDRARALLMTTSAPVTEIALASGFGDSAYFARVFREETGMTPSDFRTRHRTF